MRSSRRHVALALVMGVGLVLAGCIPEANRERGGDPGGDIGNWSEEINLHGEHEGWERMYYQTPRMGMGIERSAGGE